MAMRPTTRDEFEIAIICALPLEADAVNHLVDEFWPNDYQRAVGDANHYTTGRIGKHNIVLLTLPGIGKAEAAGAAASLNASFTKLRFALLVGICGAVPSPTSNEDEILLGDVIISNSLVQYDFGRRCPGGVFLRKTSVHDSLGKLNKDLRSLLRFLETDRGREKLEERTAECLKKLQTAHFKRPKKRGKRGKYTYPGTCHDKLFAPHYRHIHQDPTMTCCNDTTSCDAVLQSSCFDVGCEEKYLVVREQLVSKKELEQEDPERAQDPIIHIGPIASGDTMMRSGEDRDKIANEADIIAFEMEGAGIWDEMPCLVIKGACDYADSHKHKQWQNFAAATAAAAMAAVLEALIETEKPRPELEVVAQLLPANPQDRSKILSLPKAQILQFLQNSLFGQLCKEMPLSPVMVIDARGCYLPFHLETISSKKLFVEVLKCRFMDLGTEKIDRGEWFLEDQNTGKQLDLSRPWQSIIKPGQVLKMGMVFQGRNKARTNCPSCNFTNSGLALKQVVCHRCGLTYHRAKKIVGIDVVEDDDDGSTPDTESAESPANAREPRKVGVSSPQQLRPQPPKSESSEDDISRYRYVRLLDVDLMIKRFMNTADGIQDPPILLHPSDRDDLERVAYLLAQGSDPHQVDIDMFWRVSLAALREPWGQFTMIIHSRPHGSNRPSRPYSQARFYRVTKQGESNYLSPLCLQMPWVFSSRDVQREWQRQIDNARTPLYEWLSRGQKGWGLQIIDRVRKYT